jgi:mono/diheme cytochrome c family protein
MRWPALILALCSLCAPAAQPLARSLDELREFYGISCARCHGADGSCASDYQKKLCSTDFTDPKVMAKVSDARLVKTIRKGIFFGVVMPPFKKRLSEAETLVLVQEILRKAEKGKVIAAAR